MNSLFTHISAWWTRYSDYQWKKAPDGQLYLLPTADATPRPYNILSDPKQLVLDAVGVGQICMKKASTRTERMEAIKGFTCKYGLMGLAGFDDNAPSYHLTLQGKPQMVWDFHSLLLCVKLLFSTMLTDDDHPLRMCRKCRKAFVAENGEQVICSECN